MSPIQRRCFGELLERLGPAADDRLRQLDHVLELRRVRERPTGVELEP